METQSENGRLPRPERATSRAARRISVLAVQGLFVLFLLSGQAALAQMKHQSMIHEKGQHVMPFMLSKTLHIFEMTESGGIQEVVVRDPGDQEQIALIQQHLRHEAMQFRKGDYQIRPRFTARVCPA